MREATTFIKLDRNIMNWRWLQDPSTLAVWVYLLVNANNEARDYRDFTVERGEVSCTVAQISEKMGLSARSVRTALEHLTKTGEIVKKRQTNKFTIYIIVEFDRYQAKPTNDRQTTDNPSTNDRQTTDNRPTTLKEVEEWEEEKKYKKYKNRGRAYAREAPKTGAALFEEIGEELRRQEAEEAKRNDAGGNE